MNVRVPYSISLNTVSLSFLELNVCETQESYSNLGDCGVTLILIYMLSRVVESSGGVYFGSTFMSFSSFFAI